MTDQANPSGMPDENLVGDNQEKKDFVAYETYQKTLAQEKAAKEKLREYETRFKQIEETKLKEEGEYKKIAEIRAEEARKEKQRADSLEKDMNDTWKLQAFFEKLPGNLKSNDYLTHVDIDSIVLDPETRQVEMASIEKVVNSFMEKHSGLVDIKKSSGLPSEAAKPAAKKSLNEMSESERMAFMKDSLMSSLQKN
jgi:hypothetical protein